MRPNVRISGSFAGGPEEPSAVNAFTSARTAGVESMGRMIGDGVAMGAQAIVQGKLNKSRDYSMAQVRQFLPRGASFGSSAPTYQPKNNQGAFEAIGGVPREILYDRMKTAVIGEGETGGIVYNRSLVDLARHYGFHPKACRPYRAKTKGKVERPFRYIREDFFLARTFRNLDDMNQQLRHWLDTVANPCVHATTLRVVNEAFAEERVSLLPLPLAPFRSVLKLERRISRDGMVSIGGNAYSVPDATRRRLVEVHMLASEVRIFEEGILIATHPLLEGRRLLRVEQGHRRAVTAADRRARKSGRPAIAAAGDVVAQRPLAFYDAVAQALAREGRA